VSNALNAPNYCADIYSVITCFGGGLEGNHTITVRAEVVVQQKPRAVWQRLPVAQCLPAHLESCK